MNLDEKANDRNGKTDEIVETPEKDVVGHFPPWAIDVFPLANANKDSCEPSLNDKSESNVDEV